MATAKVLYPGFRAMRSPRRGALRGCPSVERAVCARKAGKERKKQYSDWPQLLINVSALSNTLFTNT